MKTAILLATLKGEKLAAKVLRHGAYSDVLAELKERVKRGRGEPGYDTLEVWTGPPAKKYSRFEVGDEIDDLAVIVLDEMPTPEELARVVKAWEETHLELTTRITDLEALLVEAETRLAEAETKFHGATPEGADKASAVHGPSPGEIGSLSGGNRDDFTESPSHEETGRAEEDDARESDLLGAPVTDGTGQGSPMSPRKKR